MAVSFISLCFLCFEVQLSMCFPNSASILRSFGTHICPSVSFTNILSLKPCVFYTQHVNFHFLMYSVCGGSTVHTILPKGCHQVCSVSIFCSNAVFYCLSSIILLYVHIVMMAVGKPECSGCDDPGTCDTAADCSDCPAGTFSLTASTNCTECERGTISR